MKPKSTIILCDNHTAQIKFFDIQDLPQIRYDSDKLNEYSEFKRIQELLSSYIDNAKILMTTLSIVLFFIQICTVLLAIL